MQHITFREFFYRPAPLPGLILNTIFLEPLMAVITLLSLFVLLTLPPTRSFSAELRFASCETGTFFLRAA